MVYRSSQMI